MKVSAALVNTNVGEAYLDSGGGRIAAMDKTGIDMQVFMWNFNIPVMHIIYPPVLKNIFCLVLFLILLIANSIVFASEKEEAVLQENTVFQKKETVRLSKYLSLGVKVKRLDNSHTSYEFGNPDPPGQAPLSRLEFPLDSWWVGGELRASFPRFSMGIEVLQSAQGNVGGRMYDSDWDDASAPLDAKTDYGVFRCRMEPSYMARADIDMEVADWLGLPQWISLRPVVGMRYQHFRLNAYNGIQYDLTGVRYEPILMPESSVIRFKQTYWQYFIGVRSGIDVGKYLGVSDLKLTTQLDWAYVEGSNEDKHMLREPDRFTYEDTYGHAWHASIGLKKGLSKNLFLSMDFDYLQIDTTGSHRWSVHSEGIDQSWGNGVKVWSEQKSISLSLEYQF